MDNFKGVGVGRIVHKGNQRNLRWSSGVINIAAGRVGEQNGRGFERRAHGIFVNV